MRQRGEQAGLIWYKDDDNYCKLVVEGMKDGLPWIVFGVETSQSPQVVAKVRLTEELPDLGLENTRLELRYDEARVSVVASYGTDGDGASVAVGGGGMVEVGLIDESVSAEFMSMVRSASVSMRAGLLVNGGEEGSGRSSVFDEFSYVEGGDSRDEEAAAWDWDFIREEASAYEVRGDASITINNSTGHLVSSRDIVWIVYMTPTSSVH